MLFLRADLRYFAVCLFSLLCQPVFDTVGAGPERVFVDVDCDFRGAMTFGKPV
jgi:hypothetical protein